MTVGCHCNVVLASNGLRLSPSILSFFGRANYSYKNKYLLTATLRADGSSKFGTENQWGYFPSVGGAWRVDKENFMKNQNLFTDLKFRGSYGVTGNSSGFNAYTAQFISGSVGTFYYNGQQIGAYGPNQAANLLFQEAFQAGSHPPQRRSRAHGSRPKSSRGRYGRRCWKTWSAAPAVRFPL